NSLRDGGVRFLEEHPLSGHLFNDYENSAYLQWCFAGEPPLFLDLLNVYPDQLFLDYFDMLQANARGRALLEEYRVGYVFLTVNRPGPSLVHLADFLDQDPGWVRVYEGFDGAIWVRRTPEYEPVWRGRKTAPSESFGQLEFIAKLHN